MEAKILDNLHTTKPMPKKQVSKHVRKNWQKHAENGETYPQFCQRIEQQAKVDSEILTERGRLEGLIAKKESKVAILDEVLKIDWSRWWINSSKHRFKI